MHLKKIEVPLDMCLSFRLCTFYLLCPSLFSSFYILHTIQTHNVISSRRTICRRTVLTIFASELLAPEKRRTNAIYNEMGTTATRVYERTS